MLSLLLTYTSAYINPSTGACKTYSYIEYEKIQKGVWRIQDTIQATRSLWIVCLRPSLPIHKSKSNLRSELPPVTVLTTYILQMCFIRWPLCMWATFCISFVTQHSVISYTGSQLVFTRRILYANTVIIPQFILKLLLNLLAQHRSPVN